MNWRAFAPLFIKGLPWVIAILGGIYFFGFERPGYKESNAALRQANASLDSSLKSYQRGVDAAADNAVLKSTQERKERDRLEAILELIDEANHPCLDLPVAGLLRAPEADPGPGSDGIHRAEQE